MTDYFGRGKEEINGKLWNWSKFKSTKEFPIPIELMEWVIGQDKALEECKLCIDEWTQKLLWLKKKKWWKDFEDPTKDKPPPKEWLPSGPFLLLLGDAGTGKSLIGRALSTYMTKIYKKRGIKLNDVVTWKNDIIPSNPKISIHPTPKGRELVVKAKKKEAKKGLLKRWGLRLIQGFLIGTGLLLSGVAFYLILGPWIFNTPIPWTSIPRVFYGGDFVKYLIDVLSLRTNIITLMGFGGSALFMGIFVAWIGRLLGGNLTGKGGIGGAEATKAPKLLIDNSARRAPFVDATGHGSAQLFGSIAWDPYQTGGLGTPEHQRVGAGDVHRAHLGILYIDEIKNLKGEEATTLLTVLEDGQLSIALRSQFHGGDTAAMAVSTEPVPCMNFLVAAGNLDSIPQIHHALMDRIYGYGTVVYMNNDMPNTVKNRRKFIQFIAQECKRFNLLPFSKEACVEIVEEARRKAGRLDKLTTKFRPMISIIKTASVLASNEKKKIVEAKHVTEAMNEHCKTIHRQILERITERNEAYRIVNPKAKPVIGQIHGMAIQSFREAGEQIGSVFPIRASMVKVPKGKGYFHVTGVKSKDDSWIQGSISKVRSIIAQLYGKDPATKLTHIDFAQTVGIDGPSAGIAMTLALCSIIENRPIRQDVAVTGEINISINDKIIITPIGGAHEKIMAAEKLGFEKVCIPTRNFEKDVSIKDYKIKVVGCETLADYMKEVLGEKQNDKRKA